MWYIIIGLLIVVFLIVRFIKNDGAIYQVINPKGTPMKTGSWTECNQFRRAMGSVGMSYKIKRMMMILICIPFLSQGQMANNEEWVPFNATLRGSDVYYSPKIVVSNSGISIWTNIKKVKKHSYSFKGKQLVAYNVDVVTLDECNCNDRTTNTTVIAAYDQNGKAVYYQSLKLPKFEPVVPGTFAETILEKACELYSTQFNSSLPQY